jgi:galactose oxidase
VPPSPALGGEVNLLGPADPALARTGWAPSASDQETAREAGNVLDGNAATIWHSAWSSTPPAPLPHPLTVDLKVAVPVGGLTYRQTEAGNRGAVEQRGRDRIG